jgi:glutamine synthetase adenylyltransferase
MEFITSNYAPVMFGGLIIFLLLGFPVAFSLGACGLLSQMDAEVLTAAYKAYRTETHRLALLRAEEVVDAARFREARTAVLGLWGRLLGR